MIVPMMNLLMTAKQPKTSDLSRRVSELFAMANPDDFRLLRLRQDVRKQIQSGVDVSFAYGLLGCLEFLAKDEPAMREAFEAALSLPSAPIEVRMNYANFLGAFFCHDEALEIMRKTLATHPGNAIVLELTTELAMAAADFDLASSCTDMTGRLGVSGLDDGVFALTRNPGFRLLKERIASSSVSMESLRAAMHLAGKVIRARHGAAAAWAGEFVDSPAMVTMFSVGGVVGEIAETNLMIADALVAAGLDQTGEFLTISCAKHHDAD